VVPQIKSIEIAEVPNLDPAGFRPPDPEDFRCTFGLLIGPGNQPGEEIFYLTVCSPSWLRKKLNETLFLWSRHHLIVPRYNLEAITAVISEFVENCSGEAWDDVARKLSRIARWEFEDYEGPGGAP